MIAAVAIALAGSLPTAYAQPGCGAWEFHLAGIPVDKSEYPTACKANPFCPQNDGDCCPTPGKDGLMLDCCNLYACEGSLHPQCKAENKTGNVCPNKKGVYDPCCSGMAFAANNPTCVKAGKSGRICPDEDGEYDDCCKPQCSYKGQCPGLAGFCCPTAAGVMLGCCGASAAEAELSAAVQSTEVAVPTSPTNVLAALVAMGCSVAVGAVAIERATRRPASTNLSPPLLA
ncbi:unnamed protein product [Prorocentrum cordatum]|uniref:Granulins domain-containing protein n=1 Tax=Prorocentrum cordatum TaxID=2364126 RepID=A0ABN9WYK8_9DINO|nr:unnamed protein product [Polarella glacialis]